MVAKKNMFLKTVALAAVFAPVALLWLGVSYGILSEREWAMGALVWAAMLPVLIIILHKWAAKKVLASSAEPAVVLDEDTRRRILREIWLRKAWIGILAVLLPVGIANGAAHRAWLPTLGGVAITLSLMYVAALEIRRRRERLNLTRQ